ncbi:MAG TPA: hypothetical protein VD948_08650 [Rhodothermales bacterium]|nr:hypothetical protein [Rhodothermales bacterium]
MPAIDGQTLAMQPPDVQELFRGTFGDQADAAWEAEHNRAVSARLGNQGAIPQRSNPVQVAPDGTVTYVNTGQTVPPAGAAAPAPTESSAPQNFVAALNPANGQPFRIPGDPSRVVVFLDGKTYVAPMAWATSQGYDPSPTHMRELPAEFAGLASSSPALPGTLANASTPAPAAGLTPGQILWRQEHGGSDEGWAQALADGTAAIWEGEARRRGITAGAGTVVNVSTGAPQTGYSIGSPTGGTVQTPFGTVTGQFGLPGNMGLEWWKHYGAIMKTLTDATGTVYSPLTGQPLSNTDGSLQKTLQAIAQEAQIRQADEALRQAQQRIDDARRTGDLDRAQRESEYARTLQFDRDKLGETQRQFDATLGYNIGTALGRIDGQNTLERDRFESEREQQLYARAANPALAFENELARGSGGSYHDPATGRAVGGVSSAVAPIARAADAPALPEARFAPAVIRDDSGGSDVVRYGPAAGAPVAATQSAQPRQTGTVRVPAFLNVLRRGGVTPTVGNFQGASTTEAAPQAALGEDFFRLQNRKAEPRLTSVQRLIRSSFGRAGGVSDDQQNDLLKLGMPKERSVTPTYSGR